MDRLKQWKEFSKVVEDHIEKYANVQYGDESETDQASNFTPEDCWQNMQRYYNRRQTAVRGRVEQLRDVVKVAHYAQMIFDKLNEGQAVV